MVFFFTKCYEIIKLNFDFIKGVLQKFSKHYDLILEIVDFVFVSHLGYMSSYIKEGSVSMSFQLNANYTMFIQTHYTNCSVKTLNVIEEPSEKAASKNSPPPFNLITLAFTGPISALKLLTKLLLIPSVQASIAVVEVGATACH